MAEIIDLEARRQALKDRLAKEATPKTGIPTPDIDDQVIELLEYMNDLVNTVTDMVIEDDGGIERVVLHLLIFEKITDLSPIGLKIIDCAKAAYALTLEGGDDDGENTPDDAA